MLSLTFHLWIQRCRFSILQLHSSVTKDIMVDFGVSAVRSEFWKFVFFMIIDAHKKILSFTQAEKSRKIQCYLSSIFFFVLNWKMYEFYIFHIFCWFIINFSYFQIFDSTQIKIILYSYIDFIIFQQNSWDLHFSLFFGKICTKNPKFEFFPNSKPYLYWKIRIYLSTGWCVDIIFSRWG